MAQHMLPIPATRGELAMLIERLINLMDRGEDTDCDACIDDMYRDPSAIYLMPGDIEDDEEGEDREPGEDDEVDDEDCCAADDRLAGFRQHRPTPCGPIIATVDRDGSVPALRLVWAPAGRLGARA